MTARQFAALHARMVQQRAERRWLDRPLQAGDYVQAHVGGDIRIVVAVVSAGEFLDQQSQRVLWPRRGGSSAEACAMYGTPHTRTPKPKETR